MKSLIVLLTLTLASVHIQASQQDPDKVDASMNLVSYTLPINTFKENNIQHWLLKPKLTLKLCSNCQFKTYRLPRSLKVNSQGNAYSQREVRSLLEPNNTPWVRIGINRSSSEVTYLELLQDKEAEPTQDKSAHWTISE